MIGETIERVRAAPAAGAGLSAGDVAALGRYLADLEVVAPGLASAARRYVLDGEGDAPSLIASPATAPSWNDLYPLQEAKTRAARRLFLAPQGWDVAAVRRLGEVVAAYLAVTGQAAQMPGTTASPEFFRALLHGADRCLRGREPAPAGASWLLDGAHCLQLLALDGADQAALTDALFATPAQHPWGAAPTALLNMAGLGEALAAAPARALAGARSLDPRGRVRFIVFLGRGGVAARPEFFDFLFELVTRGGKAERRAALAALAACPEPQVFDRAAGLLGSERADDRLGAVTALASRATPGARALIERYAPGETARRVRQAIEESLEPLRLAGRPGADVDDARGYRGIDGAWIAIPRAEPPPPDEPPPAGLGAGLEAAVAAANCEAEREFAERRARRAASPWDEPERRFAPGRYAEPYPAEAIGEFVDVMAGRVDPRCAAERTRTLAAPPGQDYPSAARLYEARLEALLGDPAVTLHHLARLTALQPGPPGLWTSHLTDAAEGGSPARRVLAKRAEAAGDLRPTLAVCAAVGGDARTFLTGILQQDWGRRFVDVHAPDPTRVWPVVAENLDLLDQAFGLAAAPPAASLHMTRALELLATLPAPPRRHLNVLLDCALDGRKDHEALARAILASTRGLGALIAPFLSSGARSRRIGAAEWLRAQRDRQALPALRAALERERTDAGRAAIVGALDALGDDISDQFAEPRLLAEARAGLARTKSAVGACAPPGRLPPLAWRDGPSVPPEIVRWWLVLADKLKTPRGDPLLNLALDRLERSSAERLATFVLSSFIAYDTLRPTEAEANAFAEANADRLWRSRRRWSPAFRREDAFAMLRRERLASYRRTAIAHRGILALARRAPASEAVAMVKTYFRDHCGRAQQCKALLDALANNPAPAALQFALAIATRWRAAGVRRHADALVDAIAAARGWTREELADRAIPTGGLDAHGALAIPVGDGVYSATLGADLRVALRNPCGRIVRRPPAGDDAAATRARAALAALKQDLRQTIERQATRLHEAMCAGRIWPTAEIEAHLFGHPIVGRLCERLIFAGFDADRQIAATFRPLGAGRYAGSRDEPIRLAAFASVGIAHRALLDEAQALAWRDRLREHGIAPPFEQLARPLLVPDAARREEHAILDREGWMLEPFALRAAARRLGYQRGAPADGVHFTTYEKAFRAAERVAIIEFTGSRARERDAPCALVGLSFASGAPMARRRALPLSAVPPILLSEAWNDLHAIAAEGPGFDPDWRTRARG
ncbi:MAG: DUF4132 domain-containing protein [Roseiarcus sp.]